MSAAGALGEAITARQDEVRLRVDDVVHFGGGAFAGEAELAFGDAHGRAWFRIFPSGCLAITLYLRSAGHPPTEVVLDEQDGDRLDGLRQRLAEALTAGSGAAWPGERGTQVLDAR